MYKIIDIHYTGTRPVITALLDSVEDLAALGTDYNPGSVAILKQGTPDQYRLNDNKEWEPKSGPAELPFGETTTVKEVLAECQPEFVADEALFVLNPVPDIEAGAEYIVNWNGVEYKCTAVQTADDSTAKVVALGNMSSAGGENTGEPFTIGANYGEQTGCFVIPLDGSTTLTLSIRQEVTEVQKISGKYVEGMGWAEKSVGFAGDTQTITFTTNENGYAEKGELSVYGDLIYKKDGVFYSGVNCTAERPIEPVNADVYSYSCFKYYDANGNYGGAIIIVTSAGYETYTEFHEFPANSEITLEIGPGGEVETIHPIDEKFIVLTSPNGTKYNLTVADDGTLSAVAAE